MLVLTDGPVRNTNPLLRAFRSAAEVKEFKYLDRNAMARWIKSYVAGLGSSIAPAALTLLWQWVGGDQRTLSSELDKLALYATGRAITERDVRELVSQIREANIFAAADALIEGRLSTGVQLVQRLRSDGVGFPQIISRLADQIRRILLAKEVLDDGGGPAEIKELLRTPHEFVVKQVTQQAGRLSRMRLESLYSSLLEADLSIKRGQLDEDLALDILLSKFSSPMHARRASRR
jgi:DNA polymerase-3 subunit delta